MTEDEARLLTDTNPNAFPCPDCGRRMAVFHVYVTDIFHKKPECERFNARDAAYKRLVPDADAARREANRDTLPRFIPDA